MSEFPDCADRAPEECWYVIPLDVILPRKSLQIYPEKGFARGGVREVSGGVEFDSVGPLDADQPSNCTNLVAHCEKKLHFSPF